jgi:hypothetical protein
MKRVIHKRIHLSSVLCIGLLVIFILQADIFASSAIRPFHSARSQTLCGNVEVVPTPSTGLYGDEILISINISNNQCQMCALGFDLFYETSMFSYQGIETLNCLTSDWSTVDADEISPGQVRIGGFAGSGSCIESTDNGCLVKVKLQVVCQCPGCMDGQQSTITIDSYTDELASFEPQPAQGTFTFICCCGDISLPAGKSGTWGDIIRLPVNIANNENQICNFAFDFVFDASVFDFKGLERSVAIQNWSTLNWSQTSPGKIHINGAVGSGTCVSAMSTGSLATMRMMVKCVGYGTDTSLPLRIEAYQDGISCMCPRVVEASFLYRACPQLGDVNGDGTLTPGDAQKAFEIYLGRLTPTLNQLTISDANCSCPCNSMEHTAQNNCTTPGDAQWIFEHYLGKKVLPLCCANYQCGTSSVMIQREVSIPFDGNREVYALPAIGNSGERLIIPIMANNPEGLRDFSLEMIYPQDLLEYKGLLASPLTQRFEYVRGEEEVPGVVRIQGLGEEGITARESGSLCVAVFHAREGISGSAPVVLNSLSGDMCRVDAESMVFVQTKLLRDEESSVSLGKGREQKGMLVVPVRISNAFGMKAFGFEVNFSPHKMAFVGVNRTDLTEDFVAVDGNDIERGLVRIGGYSMNGIQDTGGGILVELVFHVREPGGEVKIIRAFDDLKRFNITR